MVWLRNLHFTEIIYANRDDVPISRRCLALINNLLDPDGMGGFRVEIQSKGMEKIVCEDLFPNLRCIGSSWPIAPVTFQHMASKLVKG